MGRRELSGASRALQVVDKLTGPVEDEARFPNKLCTKNHEHKSKSEKKGDDRQIPTETADFLPTASASPSIDT
jgi:hypothetical protein